MRGVRACMRARRAFVQAYYLILGAPSCAAGLVGLGWATAALDEALGHDAPGMGVLVGLGLQAVSWGLQVSVAHLQHAARKCNAQHLSNATSVATYIQSHRLWLGMLTFAAGPGFAGRSGALAGGAEQPVDGHEADD